MSDAVHIPWEVAAAEICDAVEKASEKLLRRAADDFYQKLLDTTQDYLRDNAEFNLASELSAARSQAASDREAATALLARVAELEAALTGLSNMYGSAWDRADGGLTMLGESIPRFEQTHHAAQVALGTAPPEFQDDEDAALSTTERGGS